MNAIWIKNFALSAVACSLAAGTAAMAGPLGVVVDFSCADGQGIKGPNGGNLCSGGLGPGQSSPTGVGTNKAVTSWTQGFTGSAGAGSVNLAFSGTTSGKTPVAQPTVWNTKGGDPAPAISSNAAGHETTNVTMTGDYLFSFVGVDLGMNPGNTPEEIAYTITGYDGSTEEFTQSGVICKTGNTETCTPNTLDFVWVSSSSADLLTDLVITVNDAYGVSWMDNVDVDAVVAPEPGSLFLLGTGLFGLAFMVFRKSRSAGLSLNS